MSTERVRWTSAIDSPHGFLLLIASTTPVGMAFASKITAANAWYITLAMFVATVLIGWPSYRLEPTELVIRSGLLIALRIPYGDILQADPCIDWRIAVAMSRRRVRIVVRSSDSQNAKSYWISPRAKPAFLSTLRTRKAR